MVEKYITELLYKHDCVVVAGLGGFILNYKNAVIDEATGIIKPPSKELAFNSSLSKDDGLLCSYIALRRNISFNDAKSYVDAFVKSLYCRLALKENVYLSGLGNFSFDEDENIVFDVQPGANFYTDYIYLSNYQLDRVACDDVPLSQGGKYIPIYKRPAIKYAASILLILGVGTVSYLGADYYLKHELRAGFGVKSQEKTNVVEKQDAELEKASTISIVSADKPLEETVEVKESVDAVELVAAQPSEVQSMEIAETPVKEDKLTVESSVTDVVEDNSIVIAKGDVVRHYIVVASYPYRQSEEAKRHAARLQARGYDLAGVIEAEGRNRVVVYGSDGFVETENMLETIRQDVSSSAWILSY